MSISGWITIIYEGLGRLADTSLPGGENVILNHHQYQNSGHLRSKRTRPDASWQDHKQDGADLSGTMEGAGGFGGLLARSHGYSGGAGTWGTHHAYHADGGGNITALVASNQTLSATYKYDPYGRSGSMAAANTQRFSSKEIIPSTGFYYYGYRFYDPEHQRWLNRDPIAEAGGINLFGFVRNTPNNAMDSFGLLVVSPKVPWPIVVVRPIVNGFPTAVVGQCVVWAFGMCVDFWPMPSPDPLPLPPNKQRPGFPRPTSPAISCNTPAPNSGYRRLPNIPPSPFPPRRSKTCTYECVYSGIGSITLPDDGFPCPSVIDQEGEVCRLISTPPGL